MLGDGKLAAGLRLLPELAERAVHPLGDQLGLSLEDTARGIVTVATSAMANAMREITIARGGTPPGASDRIRGRWSALRNLLAAELGVRR